MKILYFNNGSGLGTAKSGGTARQIETARRLLARGVEINIATTPGAYHLYQQEGLAANYFPVRGSIFRRTERNHFDRMFSYLVSTFDSLFHLSKFPLCEIVYSPSDYFCDVIPTYFYKKWRTKGKAKAVAMVHHLCRPPLTRRGNFIINALSYYCQRFSFWFIRRYADRILVYETPEGSQIARYFSDRGFAASKIIPVANGIDIAAITKVADQDIKFDGCFAGGFRASKGIYDILNIWRLVCDKRPGATIAMAGEGPRAIMEEYRALIKQQGLEKNIILVGALRSNELYRLLKSSRVFVSASREEGWGIAVCEALACGLPVVAFKLPAFAFLQDNIFQVNQGEHQEFADRIIRTLEEDSSAEKQRRISFIGQYGWDEISNKEYNILNQVLC